MTLTYSLTESDFLQAQLFMASKAEHIKNQRIRSWILISLCFFVIGFIFVRGDNYALGYCFIGVGLLNSFFYPLYEAGYYRRHYQKHIKETFKNRIDKSATVTFLSPTSICFS